jgi:hypothetical protein
VLDITDEEGFQQQLSRVAEARREVQRLKARREAVLAELEAAAEEIEEKREQLAKEHEDVVRLESFSISRVVTSLRGEHDEQLRKEIAEREAARVAYLAAEERERAALNELHSIDDRLAAMGDVDAEWERVIDARQRWLEATSASPETPAAARVPDPSGLHDLVERRGVIEAELRDVDEVLAAAHLAAARLAHASAVIGSASSWKGYEAWFGGGMLSRMYDHDRLDAAAAGLREVDNVMTVLRRELADLRAAGVADIEVRGWDRTFEAFLDNFFNDLAIDERVRAAAEKVSSLRTEIDRLLLVVAEHRRRLEDEAERLLEHRMALTGGEM